MAERALVVMTKVRLPPRRPDLLRRPRLVDFLHTYIDRKLIAVVAPAGYGKTTLLVDFAHEIDAIVCWYSLDRYDTDLRAFLDHLLTSIQHQLPGFGKRIRAAIANLPDVTQNVHVLAGILANELAEVPEYVIIILDDFHEVAQSDSIGEFLSLFLQYIEENVHLIIASRTVPALPNISLLVARQEMVGLGVEMLRFTPEEVQALVRQNYGLEMPRERAEDLARHSDGWITGILLMAQSIGWRRILEGAITLPSASRHVYEYLAEQVLDQQSPLLRDFLLSTSVLEELSAEQCNALLGIEKAAEYLEALYKRNLFITETGPDTFIYHPLFRDFLRSRLRRLYPRKFQSLALKAAHLYMERNEPERAISLYIDLGYYDEAAQAIEKAERALFDRGRWEFLTHALNKLPEPLLHKHPALLSIMARICAEQGNTDDAENLYNKALSLFIQRNDTEQISRVKLRKSILLFYTGKYRESLKLLESALSTASDIPEGPAKYALTGGIIGLRGLVSRYLGNPDRSIPDLKKAFELFGKAGDILGKGYAAHNLGACLSDTGKYSEAIKMYNEAIKSWEELGYTSGLIITISQLAKTYSRRGDIKKSEELLGKSVFMAKDIGLERWESMALSVLADVMWIKGLHNESLKIYLDSANKAKKSNNKFTEIYAYLGYSFGLCATKMVNEAHKIIAEISNDPILEYSVYLRGLVDFVQGTYYLTNNNYDEALHCIESAYRKFSGCGFVHETARTCAYIAYIYDILDFRRKSKEMIDNTINTLSKIEGDNNTILMFDAPIIGEFMANIGLIPTDHQIPSTSHISDTAPKYEDSLPNDITLEDKLTIYGFGYPRILLGGKEIIKDRDVVKKLFFYLLINYPNRVERSAVAEALWPELSPGKAAANLRITLYRLRKSIDIIYADDHTLSLNIETDTWYDVWMFEEYIKKADNASRSEDKAEMYNKALSLYVDDFLVNMDGMWVVSERERLHRQKIYALMSLALCEEETKDYKNAIEHYKLVLQDEPYHEDAWRGLMRAYALSGNRGAAIQTYQRMVRLLKEDLGVEPAPATQALYRSILDMRL